MNELAVSEVFGPTVQGEGPYTGRRAFFVRLGGCNLACTWCDTSYTWDSQKFDLRLEIKPWSVRDIISTIGEFRGMVVITGGEPLLQAHQPEFLNLLNALHQRGHAVHLESNGTIVPSTEILKLLDVIVLSPKLPNAGNHRGRNNRGLHRDWPARAVGREVHLKLVCIDSSDVSAGAKLADTLGWPRERVWIMPEGQTPERIMARLPELADAAIAHGLNVTSRLHVFLWGNERAR